MRAMARIWDLDCCEGKKIPALKISQNHRVVEVRRELWRSPAPSPAPAGPLKSRVPRTRSRSLVPLSQEVTPQTSTLTVLLCGCFIVFLTATAQPACPKGCVRASSLTAADTSPLQLFPLLA